MTSEFIAHALVGICYSRRGRLYLQEAKEELDLTSALSRLQGRKVHYLFQYLPENPTPAKWGLGSCRWEPSSQCPARHHERPEYMLDTHGVGQLCRSADGQDGVLVEGAFKALPLSLLDGHRCRVAVVTAFDVEAEMAKIQMGGLESIEDLLAVATQAQEVLAQLQKNVGGSE